MKEGHIFIQGVISPWQDNDPGKWGEVNIKSVTEQIQNNQDAEKLIVHIHTPGGDVTEGFGIHDLLDTSGKEIETRIEGLCASIGTVIFLAGSTRLMTENSDFMIHNPFGWAEGDATEMQKYADQLKDVEEKIINFYAEKTGADKEALTAMMNADTWLTSDQAKELGFVTEIITNIKAVATFKLKNNQMNTQELETKMEAKFSGLEAILNKIKTALNLTGVKNITVTAGDGTVLDFGDQAQTVEEIAVDMTATIEGGGVPTGDYAMPDGSTYVFDAGTLTEIKAAEGGDEEMEALKEQVEALTQELADEKAKNEAQTQNITELSEAITAVKAELKSDLQTVEKGGVPAKGNEGDPVNRFEGLMDKKIKE